MATTPFNYGFGGESSGAFIIPNKYKFADTAARDLYFNTTSHKKELIRQKTFIMVGAEIQSWLGGNNPANYNPANWEDTSQAVKGDKGDKGNDGAGVDISALKQGEIPSWDVATKTLIPSGVHATDGEITVSPDSVIFGNHKMSSSVDNVVFENEETGKHYVPIWQAYDGTDDDAHIRVHSQPEVVIRVPDGNIDVTNPTNTGLVVDADETFIGGTFTLSQPARDVRLEIYDNKGTLAWRDKFGDLSAGSHTVVFDTPADVLQGYGYTIKLLSGKGDLVAKSNAPAGFSWKVNRVKWVSKALAKAEDLDDTIIDISILGTAMTITHYDGAKHVIQLPTSGGGAVNPKTVVGVTKRNGSFVFTNADGSTTTLKDNTGATTTSLNAVKADVQTLQTDVQSLKDEDTSLAGRIAHLEGKPVIPPKTTPKFYGIFDTTWPASLTGASTSVGKSVTMVKNGDTAQRAFIIVPTDHADSVTGIKEGDGLPSLWRSTDRTYGSGNYKVFYSPRALNERTATFTLTFSQGDLYV